MANKDLKHTSLFIYQMHGLPLTLKKQSEYWHFREEDGSMAQTW